MDEKQIYAAILKDLLQKTTLSYSEIATKSGYRERSIYNLKNGKHKPSLSGFCRILRVLGEDPVEVVSKIIQEMEGKR